MLEFASAHLNISIREKYTILMNEEELLQYWYHGSKKLFTRLRKQKAIAPEGRPAEEALEAIYFTPDFAFALACATRPPGITEIDLEKRTIHFENPDQFHPDEMVYIYSIDPNRIPDDQRIWVDELQVAVMLDEIEPEQVDNYKGIKLLEFFLTNVEIKKDR